MLLFGSPCTSSADEHTTAGDNLALSDQPASNETLASQSGSTIPPTTTVSTNNIQQGQQNTINVLPTTMNMAITKNGSVGVGDSASSASITSSVSATVVQSGM